MKQNLIPVKIYKFSPRLTLQCKLWVKGWGGVCQEVRCLVEKGMIYIYITLANASLSFETLFIWVLFDINNKNVFYRGRKIELSVNPQNF